MNVDKKFILAHVTLQSFLGLFPSGILYAWGAFVGPINKTFNPNSPKLFEHNHGLFCGIIMLCMSSSFMPLLRGILDNKLLTEFWAQVVGIILTFLGLFMQGLSLHYSYLWLLYVGAITTGFGALFNFQRIIFNHQLWFKHIGSPNIGAGIFGFMIGIWTTICFLISVPMFANLSASQSLYLYAGLTMIATLYPLYSIVPVPTAIKTQATAGECDEADVRDKGNVSELAAVGKPSVELGQYHTDDEVMPFSVGNVDSNSILDDNGAKKCLVADFGLIAVNSASVAGVDMVTLPASNPTVATRHEVDIDDNGHFALTMGEILAIPQTWQLILFFSTILTPGWGIQLASYSLLSNLFDVSTQFSASVTAVYATAYAFGRLFSGFLAEYIGVFRTYDLIIVSMIVLLVSMPTCAVSLPHSSQHASGCLVFVVLVCVIGLMYGGAIVLFYSIVFDIFGARNYRPVFSVAMIGFGISVVAGGLISGFSFGASKHKETSVELRHKSFLWFYFIAGGCGLALLILHSIKPYDYQYNLQFKIKAKESRGRYKSLASRVSKAGSNMMSIIMLLCTHRIVTDPKIHVANNDV